MSTPHMSTFTIKPLQETQIQLSSFTHCKHYSTISTLKFHHKFNISPANNAFNQRFSPFLVVRAHTAHLETNLPSCIHQNVSRSTIKYKASEQNSSGFSSSSSATTTTNRRAGQSSFRSALEEDVEEMVVLKERAMGRQFSSMRCKDEFTLQRTKKTQSSEKGRDKLVKKLDKGRVNHLDRVGKSSKKSKVDSSGAMLRVGLDMCSKRGDVVGAIRLYDLARKEEMKLEQYHYAVLLYLCSSAAAGVVHPAKSGSGNRSLNPFGLSKEISWVDSERTSQFEQPRSRNFVTGQPDSDSVVEESGKEGFNINDFPSEVVVYDSKSNLRMNKDPIIFSNGSEPYPQTLDEMVQLMKCNADYGNMNDIVGEEEVPGIQVSEDVKKYALRKGFEIYENMILEKVPMNEATFTSVARMAMSLGDGDMAFDIVKQMKEIGISPRLRSYGPALSVFCNNGDVEKAFIVEEHMLEHGVCPEEPELEALLRVSVEVGRSDKVYYLLHKLRTSVRQVLPSTADLIEKWFRSKTASKVGKKKWSQRMVMEAIQNGGGGWHGQGWLGKGKWTVSPTSVGSDGLCKFCGEKLVTIDLDPVETENFSRSVASIALQREKNSSFQNFQKWLDYYGPFEAVVDGANVGVYSQRNFKPSKVNAVVNGIRQMLPSKRWPLIVLHNRRITGDHRMNKPVNKAMIEKWRNADALYATPTGSNDDWYWLYAAIKFKCLIVTNDEMRDHLFQLLGKDFFPKWKERHQVHFSFSETGPVFHMPPPCSVVIQESEKGHWHIPIVSEFESHGERTWLCITRTGSLTTGQESSIIHDGLHNPHDKNNPTSSGIRRKMVPGGHGNHGHNKQAPQETYKNLKHILSSSLLSNSHSILPDLEDAEDFGGCTIDFQI